MSIDGETFDEARDGLRLTSQLDRVRTLMEDGRWRTLERIAKVVGGSESSIGARLRDLRKTKFGSFRVERDHIKGGLWQYRVLPPLPSDQEELFEAAE